MPIVAMVDQATLPTYFAFFPLFRAILLRERITIVHGHTATSPLIHDSILQAKVMGYKCMFTGAWGRGVRWEPLARTPAPPLPQTTPCSASPTPRAST